MLMHMPENMAFEYAAGIPEVRFRLRFPRAYSDPLSA
jgi:hypothetical protein